MISKDFDSWNEQKKIVDSRNLKFYHPQEIWWCSLGLNIGFEQNGKGEYYHRPVLILRAFSKHVCLVIPLSTSKKENKYYLPIGIIEGKESFAIISQLRLIDVRRLINKIITIDKDVFEIIRKAAKEIL